MTEEIDRFHDDAISTQVYTALREFANQFDKLGEGGELERLCTTKKRFRGQRIGRQPENFTEEFLIEPLLEALGYPKRGSAEFAPGSPHFRPQPSSFRYVEARRPDYLIENLENSIICFLEAKPVNAEHVDGSKRAATEQIREYVQSNTFCQNLRTADHSHFIGIGTDGFRWVRFVKNVESDELIREREIVDISPLVTAIGRSEGPLRGEADRSRKETLDEIRDGLVETFGARHVADPIPMG